MRVDIETLNNEQLMDVIICNINKRKFTKYAIEAMMAAFCLLFLIKNNLVTDKKQSREVVITNIKQIIGDRVTKPESVK